MGTEKPSSRDVTAPKAGATPVRNDVPENNELDDVDPLLATTVTDAVSPGDIPVTSARPRSWFTHATANPVAGVNE